MASNTSPPITPLTRPSSASQAVGTTPNPEFSNALQAQLSHNLLSLPSAIVWRPQSPSADSWNSDDEEGFHELMNEPLNDNRQSDCATLSRDPLRLSSTTNDKGKRYSSQRPQNSNSEAESPLRVRTPSTDAEEGAGGGSPTPHYSSADDAICPEPQKGAQRPKFGSRDGRRAQGTTGQESRSKGAGVQPLAYSSDDSSPSAPTASNSGLHTNSGCEEASRGPTVPAVQGSAKQIQGFIVPLVISPDACKQAGVNVDSVYNCLKELRPKALRKPDADGVKSDK